MLVINLCAGPGAGKSWLARDLTNRLSANGLQVEYVSEVAKMWVLEGHISKCKEHQILLFAQQLYQQTLFENAGVDAIVCDSPLFLAEVYLNFYGNKADTLSNLIREEFNKRNNYNVLIKRSVGEYSKIGRYQSQEEAIKIDRNIEGWLQMYNHRYVSFQRGCEQDLTDRILREVEGLV